MGEKKSPLDVLFPYAEIDRFDGTGKIKVKPLTLPDITKVAKTFASIIDKAKNISSPGELAIDAATELANLVPLCTGLPGSDILAADLPAIINIIIDQNLPESALGKWKALVGKLQLEGLLAKGQSSLSAK